jgi:CrcB protein
LKDIEFLFLGVGAILGAFMRYKITSFPIVYGIMGSNVIIVNIIGCFVLGIFSVLSVYLNWDPQFSFLIAVGFCGSLTTMSSFALENIIMFENKQLFNILLYTSANVFFSILSLYGGRILINLFLI